MPSHISAAAPAGFAKTYPHLALGLAPHGVYANLSDHPEGLRLHDLRHTAATLAATTGATTKELMARLGHASPRAALSYQHATQDRDQAIADALTGLVEQAGLASVTTLQGGVSTDRKRARQGR